MKKLIYLLAVSAVLVLPSCNNDSKSTADSSDSTAGATDTTLTSEPGAAVASADTTFANKAAIGGMAEVDFGKLALEKAANAKVKEFASMMVNDHGTANDELKTIASKKSMMLPETLDAEHAAIRADLVSKTGAEFDKAYVQAMVDGHKKTLALMQDGSQNCQDADLKAFAAKTAPVVKHHLDMIVSIQSEMK